MRLLIVAATLVGAALVAMPSASKSNAAECTNSSDRAALITDLIAGYERIANLVEAVPPSEADYIRKETQEALRIQSPARFNLVQSNRFYHALKVRDAVDAVIQHLMAAQAATTVVSQASEMIDALEKAGDLKVGVSDYIDADTGVLSEDDGVLRISFSMEMANNSIARAAKCFLKGIDERQKG